MVERAGAPISGFIATDSVGADRAPGTIVKYHIPVHLHTYSCMRACACVIRARSPATHYNLARAHKRR